MLACMNQAEIWLSILVRKLLKRGNFLSASPSRLARPDSRLHRALQSPVAKPITWTYTGIA
jgi:hypothetical protein